MMDAVRDEAKVLEELIKEARRQQAERDLEAKPGGADTFEYHYLGSNLSIFITPVLDIPFHP